MNKKNSIKISLCKETEPKLIGAKTHRDVHLLPKLLKQSIKIQLEEYFLSWFNNVNDQ